LSGKEIDAKIKKDGDSERMERRSKNKERLTDIYIHTYKKTDG